MTVTLPDLPVAFRLPRRGARWPQTIEERIEVTELEWNGSHCWRWLGAHRKTDGRPTLSNEYVYRILYEAVRGPLPRGKGHAGHHSCQNDWCINPWHLEALSQSEHMKTHGFGGDRGQAKKTHCPAGHPYDEANTYRYKGERHCIACRRARDHKRRAAP